MSQLSITVRDNQVRTINDNLILAVKRLPAGVMRPIMDQAKKEAAGGFPDGGYSGYQVPDTGGHYIRTGRFGSNQILSYNGGQSYTLINRTPYATYVQGDASGGGQAKVHQGRWPLLADVVERAVQRIVEAAGKAFLDIINRGPGGL